MPSIRHRRGWETPSSWTTPEEVYLNRRHFIAAMGMTAIGAMLPDNCLLAQANPVSRNEKYKLERKVSIEESIAKYNYFLEFGDNESDASKRSGSFKISPWTIEIVGLVKQPRTIDLDDLLKRMPIEERLYRHRSVEPFAMAIPWTGFPMKALIDQVEPLSSAKFVRFISANRPNEMPGVKEQWWYPWPYCEGLRMDEAVNELTFMVSGVYGHSLPIPHGSPLRLAVPWKYGYKSIKSIAKIEFAEKQPPTFWETLVPKEYPFESNVNPTVPHPRWSQARERLVDTGELVDTKMFNGYGEFVAQLYS